MFYFRSATNVNAGTDECHLKTFFKSQAKLSQQRGQDTFISQVAQRLHEHMTLNKALEAANGYKHYGAVNKDKKALSVENPGLGNQQPLYTIVYDGNQGCTFIMHSANQQTKPHPAVLQWLGNNQEKETQLVHLDPNDRTNSIDCFIEYTSPNNVKYRCHPNYQSNGPWYNWAMVNYGAESKCPLPYTVVLLTKTGFGYDRK